MLQHPSFQRRLAELGRHSDRVWFTSLGIGFAFTLIAALAFTYPESHSGKLWAYATLIVRVCLYMWAGARFPNEGGNTIVRLFKMGLVAGAFELLVDYWLANGIERGRLVFLTGNDVVLLGSPIFMPVAWASVITDLSYPALRLYGLLRGRRGAAWISTLVISVSAGLMFGFYEYFAAKAGWWKYEPARWMIGSYCALYIPLGEALVFLPVLPICAYLLKEEDRPTAAAIEAGVIFAGCIAAAFAAAYFLLER